MAGLCEGGNEPPGSLKASKLTQSKSGQRLNRFNFKTLSPYSSVNQFKQVLPYTGQKENFLYTLSVIDASWSLRKQMVRCCCRQFSAGRQNLHDEERSGRPTNIKDDLVEQRNICLLMTLDP
ncbi:hypothetical protein ANN_26619 [Periplaneta americana]|uniref:Uncharacterized protein n=1 Tax=Periplaneta americana TaxID=6978 RepID=A0ABQ8RYR5_PERAM|nr:hypothetical protein ANN_26619 [Periplaneta americana]